MTCRAIASLLFVLLVTYSATANAVTLENAITPRFGVTVGDVDELSYDGTPADAFKPFVAFTAPELLAFSSFTGSEQGASVLEFHLLSELAYYDGHISGLGDRFGVLDSSGNFNAIIGASANPGFSTTVIQDSDEEFTLAIRSPEGVFSSVDADNQDKAAHLIGLVVTQAGLVTIPRANLYGAMSTFNLQVGDVIIFLEDLLSQGNILQNGLPSDFDYNDMVVVVRSTAIPEPATALLLASGIYMLGRKRRTRR